MTNIAIIKLYQFTHSPRRQRVDQGQGTRGRRGRRGGHHDLFFFKHAKRPCKLAPGHVMIAAQSQCIAIARFRPRVNPSAREQQRRR